MTAHLGGRHLPARRIARDSVAYTLIVLIAAVAAVFTAVITGGFNS